MQEIKVLMRGGTFLPFTPKMSDNPGRQPYHLHRSRADGVQPRAFGGWQIHDWLFNSDRN